MVACIAMRAWLGHEVCVTISLYAVCSIKITGYPSTDKIIIFNGKYMQGLLSIHLMTALGICSNSMS